MGAERGPRDGLGPGDLAQISAATLESYAVRAEAFRDGTRDHDVQQNIDALLSHIEVPPPFQILDFGCGPGRALSAFTRLGHIASGLVGAAPFAALGRPDTSCV